jgi:phage antirepressor YoqD-like protein
MLSRKVIAKQMKKEIKLYLKQIRLTGGVVETNREQEFVNNYFPSFSDETKKSMISDLQKQNLEYKQKLEEQAPKVEAYDDLLNSDGYMSLKEVGDMIETGRTTLCALLRSRKIMSKQAGYNLPLNQYIKSGYFKIVAKSDDKGHVSTVPLVSPKGLNYIYKLIKKNNMQSEFNTNALTEVHA